MKPIVAVLDVSMSAWGAVEVIHPVVIQTGNNRILVDCGFVGSLPLIEAALLGHGVDPKDVTAILLTHHDHDHMGAAAAFRNKYPRVRLYASALEEPYISGAAKPLRLLQAEEMQPALPPEAKDFGHAFCELLRTVEPVQVDGLLHGDEELLDSGYRVVATPGHTPGHLSLYSRSCNTIIAGDAIALEQGKPVIANPQFTLDAAKASQSMAALLGMGAERIICYHGGEYLPG